MEVPNRVGCSKRRKMLQQFYSKPNIEWKPILGFENQYEVSNYGDFHVLPYVFYDVAGKKQTRKEKYFWSENLSEYGGDEGTDGRYLGIHLGGMAKTYAHILAARAFCPNPENKPEVNHKDGNTKNNYCGCKENNYMDSNLEWVTRKENMEHAAASGLINHESALRKWWCKINRENVDYDKLKRPVHQLTLEGKIIKTFPSISDAAKEMKVAVSNIRSVALKEGYHKTVKGFNWVFADEYDKNKDYTLVIDQGSGGRKPVIQKAMDGRIVAEYDSIKQACEITGFTGNDYISQCCRGKRKHYKNYLWEFKNKD